LSSIRADRTRIRCKVHTENRKFSAGQHPIRSWWAVKNRIHLAVLLLPVGIFGCDCFEYRYLSFEGQSDFIVVEKTTRPIGGSVRTFPPVPIEYQVSRPEYDLQVSTGGLPYPTLSARAYDSEGNALQIFSSDMVRTLPEGEYGPSRQVVTNGSSWSFNVLRDGEKVGTENFQYDIRSRWTACGWDLP